MQIAETQAALTSGNVTPNWGEMHIFKVAAHAGKHSDADKGPKLKFAIQQMLESETRPVNTDMENGVFLIRMLK